MPMMARVGRLFESVSQDMRLSLRSLGRTPWLVAVAALLLGVGIAASVMMFAIIDAVDLREPPYPDASRLVVLSEATTAVSAPGSMRSNRWPSSAATIADWRRAARSFDGMAVFGQQHYVIWQGDEADDFSPITVVPEFFRLLGTAPLLGRTLIAGDTLADAPPVAVLSFETWRDRFGGDPQILGKVLALSRDATPTSPRELRTIVGVMPKMFLFPPDAAAWIPAQSAEVSTSRSARSLWVLAKLRQGVTPSAADRELNAITRGLASLYPEDFKRFGTARVIALSDAQREAGFQAAQPGGAVKARHLEFGIGGLVLLIAMINVGTLLLARSVVRDRETAVRFALGASRSRIAQQLVVESAVISLPGAVIGMLVAALGSGALARTADLARFGVLPALDVSVLVFAVGLTIVVAIGTSLIPVLVRTRASMAAHLQGGAFAQSSSRRRSRVHGVLLVTQVASAFALATGAGFLGKELLRLETSGFAFDAHNLVWFPGIRPRTPLATPAAAWQFTQDVINKLGAVPGVASVTAIEMDFSARGLRPVERPELAEMAGGPGHLVFAVSPGFVRQLRLPVLRGRDFSHDEFAVAARVALVTAFTARQFWPGEDPIGKELAVSSSPKSSDKTSASVAAMESHLRVVGVVADARFGSPLQPPVPTVFIPATALGTPVRMAAFFLVRTDGNPTPVVPALVQHVAAIQGTVPVRSLYGTTQRALDLQLREQRLTTYAVAALALAVVLLTALGIHGLVAYAVAQRTREIAIRMALGAGALGVRAMVTRRPMQLAAIGVAVGSLGAWGVVRALRSMIQGANPADPVPIVAAAALVFGVVLLASWAPVRRATRIDPMISLRLE